MFCTLYDLYFHIFLAFFAGSTPLVSFTPFSLSISRNVPSLQPMSKALFIFPLLVMYPAISLKTSFSPTVIELKYTNASAVLLLSN